MAELNENMVFGFLDYTAKGKHIPTTVWEESQLLHAWLHRERFRQALESIEANKCCGSCQGAALVARAALGKSDGTKT